MSVTTLPHDVTVHILSYLNWRDIYLSFQPTCSEWYGIETEQTTIWTTHKVFNRKAKKSVSVRFPKLQKILIEQSTANIYSFEEQIAFCHVFEDPSADIAANTSTVFKKQVLEHFPEYCAINACAISYSNTTKKIRDDLKIMNIKHIVFNRAYANEEQLKYIIKRALPTITHLSIQVLNGTAVPFWKLICEQALKNNQELSIRHISNKEPPALIWFTHEERLTSYSWEEILSKTPHLESYVGKLTENARKELIKYCPRVTKLELVDDTGIEELLNSLPLKVLNLNTATSYTLNLPESAQKLEQFYFGSSALINLVPLTNVKRLYINVREGMIEQVIGYCTKVEELGVSDTLEQNDLLRLVEGCPRLRFMYGANDGFDVPRTKDGAVDVVEWREDLTIRPRKRRK
jgi:hypothetical protein